MNIYQINDQGLAQLKSILTVHHKKFINEEPTIEQLCAWASEMEEHTNFDEGETPFIEIKSYDSVSGHTETYNIDLAGFDKTEIED